MKHIFTTTLVASALALTACGGGVSNSSKTPNKAVVDKVAKPTTAKKKEELHYVKMETTMGDITLELNKTKAPKTVENFLQYAKSGHYNGTIFHRVIAEKYHIIQGGGLSVDMKKKPVKAPIKNEADNGLKNDAGTIAMARTNHPHSATAQFFINVKDNKWNYKKYPNGTYWGYAVFGKVVKGMDVVKKINALQTTTKAGRPDVPVEPIVILSVTEIKQK